MTSASARNAGRRYTPLRYPGGKSKLAGYVKQVLAANSLEDGHYVEPFAGGAGIAIELLLQGYVRRISLNDVSVPIYALWHSVLNDPLRFAERIMDAPLTLEEWDKHKVGFARSDASDLFELGFSAFYLNRTNRSGVLNGGVIGGRSQTGQWLIDARFNRSDLAARVMKIGRFANQITLSRLDAVEFLELGSRSWETSTLIYADPPYYVKGRQLYYDYYRESDHAALASLFCGAFRRRLWMVSYDDVPEVRALYASQASQSYFIPYSVRRVGLGGEVMFYSPELELPTDQSSGTGIKPGDRFRPTEGEASTDQA